MRFPIASKLALGLALLALLGILAMLVVYRGLSDLEEAIRQLSEVSEPASAAAHEMETNLNEIGMAVFRYLGDADPEMRRRVAENEADFERFHARYLELSGDADRVLAETVRARFQTFRELGRALLTKRDAQEQAFRLASENFETIDAVIDENQDRWQEEPGGRSWKLILSLDLEADLAEMAVWLANYQRTHSPAHRALMEANQEEFESGLARMGALRLAPHERAWVERVAALFEQTKALVGQIASADEDIRRDAAEFGALQKSLDDLLDEELQTAAHAALTAPREAADRATARVVGTLHILIPAFVLFALAVGYVLGRLITRPLHLLVRGTAAIAAGDLDYRVTGMARDELGDLADHFNHMVTRLQETTVSKTALEESEGRLRATVVDLRREIQQRHRSEAERGRLQESLRRSETMSAMGSLVAGVAHEVRNPLFGISSTLDALEARLGAREEIRPHIAVLRGEVDRLIQLMRDLLNYGRPSSGSRAPAPIAGPIEEALRSCRDFAREARVDVEAALNGAEHLVAMDRVALTQVFRNLVENAIQHAPPGGAVRVTTTVRNDEGAAFLDCTVSDSGLGFRDEDVARVFEPFFTRRRGGTGLGLSIVQRLVEEHDGHVHAGNRPEGGAAVTVTLPLAEPPGQGA